MCTHCQFSFTSFSRSFIPRVIDWLFHTNGIVGIWNVAWKTEKIFDVVPSRGSENNECFSRLFPIVRISKINVNLRYGHENLLWISLLVIPSSQNSGHFEGLKQAGSFLMNNITTVKAILGLFCQDFLKDRREKCEPDKARIMLLEDPRRILGW